jgi:multidrug efflux system membrane fusion protein
VDEDDKVRFVPVRIVEDGQNTMWVAGLTDGARVIVRGQDFVREGQVVAATAATDQRASR